ncbi:hypothetical protein V6N13_060506 [Hibiscus sabdariffa]|uniref:Uncharacterized protein n=1 Tax=Hibiscus sabdariffa TaxID=183260 RepID=A0ABR2P7M2_9ROSI
MLILLLTDFEIGWRRVHRRSELEKLYDVESGIEICSPCRLVLSAGEDDEEREKVREATMPATGDECAVPPNVTLRITLDSVSWKSVSGANDLPFFCLCLQLVSDTNDISNTNFTSHKERCPKNIKILVRT